MKRQVALLAVVLAQTFLVLAADYKVTKIPAVVPRAINAAGQVAGFVILPGNHFHAMLWTRDGGVQDLGTLGGTNSDATAINDAGQIVGKSDLPGDSITHAFLWTPGGTMQDLGAIGDQSSAATAVNSSGQVAGSLFSTQTQLFRPFRWTSNGGMQDLGSPFGGSTSVPFGGINAAGHVALTSFSANNLASRAYLWTPRSGAVELDTLFNASTSASVINDLDQIVGVAGDRAALWTPGVGGLDLGTLGGVHSYAMRINSSGLIAGASELAGNKITHTFVWSTGQGIKDLGQVPKHPNNTPFGLSDNGQVVGQETGGMFVWSQNLGMRSISAMASAVGVNNAGQVIGLTRNKTIEGAVATPVMNIALTSSQNPSHAGQSVTITAHVTSVVGAPPDGELVTFKDKAKVLGKVPLASGIASLTISTLAVGSHSIKGTYAGDSHYFSSKSPVLLQVVNP